MRHRLNCASARFYWFLGLLGFLSLVVMAVPSIGIILLFTFIGIPVAFALWAIPALFLLLLISHIIYVFFPVSGWQGKVVAFGICLALLAIQPYFARKSAEAHAVAHASNDFNRLQGRIPRSAIAFRGLGIRPPKDATPCDGLCLHALLSNTATKVLMVYTRDPHQDLRSDLKAHAFTLEKREACPAVKFGTSFHRLNLPKKKGDKRRSVMGVEVMKLKLANGVCLIHRRATLKEADYVVSWGPMKSPRQQRMNSGFKANAKPEAIRRLTVHQVGEQGEFVEIYRQTGVRYSVLAPVLLPAPNFKSLTDTSYGWLRFSRQIGSKDVNYPGSRWVNLLVNDIGFDFDLSEFDPKKEILAKLRTRLQQDRAPSQQEWDVFSEHFQNIQIGKHGGYSPEEYRLALATFQSDKFPPLPRMRRVVRYARKHSPIDLQVLAEELITQLEGEYSHELAFGISSRARAYNLMNALDRVPDEYLLPFADRHIKLATDSEILRYAHRAIKRLHIHGARAVPPIMSFLDGILVGNPNFYGVGANHGEYENAMKALCLIGDEARPALPKLQNLLATDRLPMRGQHGNIVVETFVRFGVAAETMWPHYAKVNVRNRSNSTEERVRKRFDSAVSAAARTRYACR
ncbi:MAG: hypothetical protein AAF468_17815 [Pseudomonadota bacterium]